MWVAGVVLRTPGLQKRPKAAAVRANALCWVGKLALRLGLYWFGSGVMVCAGRF